MKKSKKTLLIFSAHPDDHLGVAGTAMFLKEKGFRIVEVVFTGGEKSMDLTQKNEKPKNKKDLVVKRKSEFEKASKIMGTDKFKFLGLPDSNIKSSPELLDRLIKIIRKEKPTIVVSESPTDYHVDHRAIGNIVPQAVKRAGWRISKELGEPFKTSLGLFMGSKIEGKRIDILVNIEEFKDKKNKMLEAYESQMGKKGIQLTKALDSYFGFKVGSSAGEAFQLMTDVPIKLSNLFELLKKGKNE